jgi:hypothetical protein
MLTNEDVQEKAALQNVGDAERAIRTGVGAALLLASTVAPRRARRPLQALGALAALTGISGWCPFFHVTRVTSLDGPGDRPDEARRPSWLSSRPSNT